MIESLRPRRPTALVLSFAVSMVLATPATASPTTFEEGIIRATVSVGRIELVRGDGWDTIIAEGFGRPPDVRRAALPMRIFAIAIPPGAELVDLRYHNAPEVVIPEQLRIGASETRSWQGEANPKKGGPPPQPVTLVRTAAYRGHNLVDVQVAPFSYDADSGELSYSPEVEIIVHYRLPSDSAPPWQTESEAIEATARSIILNHDQAISWCSEKQLPAADPHDFVLITQDALVPAVQTLVEWQRTKGRSVAVVTVSEIAAEYPGHDLAEQIRNFLRAAYPPDVWGIEDVLIVGHPSNIPMRSTWGQAPNGVEPETDFYYAELSQPDAASWDSNQNGRFGEVTDTLDFYGEVNVGRIPWSDTSIVRNICEKSVAFENNHDDSYKKNILLLAAIIDPDTDGAVFAEYTVDPVLHPWMGGWTVTRLYESSAYPSNLRLNRHNTVTTWAEGRFAVVSWHSHGSPTGVYAGSHPYFDTGDTAMLDDAFPAIVSAASCSGSDTDTLNLGQALMRQGAVGYLGANKVAYYGGRWEDPDDGSDQSFKYFFLTEITSGRMTQGQAHQHALREMYVRGLWSSPIYETHIHGSLWGNPDIGLMERAARHRVRRAPMRVVP